MVPTTAQAQTSASAETDAAAKAVESFLEAEAQLKKLADVIAGNDAAKAKLQLKVQQAKNEAEEAVAKRKGAEEALRAAQAEADVKVRSWQQAQALAKKLGAMPFDGTVRKTADGVGYKAPPPA